MRPINWPITFNSIYKNHNNPFDNDGDHSLMIKRQMLTEANNDQVRKKIREFLTISLSTGYTFFCSPFDMSR